MENSEDLNDEIEMLSMQQQESQQMIQKQNEYIQYLRDTIEKCFPNHKIDEHMNLVFKKQQYEDLQNMLAQSDDYMTLSQTQRDTNQSVLILLDKLQELYEKYKQQSAITSNLATQLINQQQIYITTAEQLRQNEINDGEVEQLQDIIILLNNQIVNEQNKQIELQQKFIQLIQQKSQYIKLMNQIQCDLDQKEVTQQIYVDQCQELQQQIDSMQKLLKTYTSADNEKALQQKNEIKEDIQNVYRQLNEINCIQEQIDITKGQIDTLTTKQLCKKQIELNNQIEEVIDDLLDKKCIQNTQQFQYNNKDFQTILKITNQQSQYLQEKNDILQKQIEKYEQIIQNTQLNIDLKENNLIEGIEDDLQQLKQNVQQLENINEEIEKIKQEIGIVQIKQKQIKQQFDKSYKILKQ